MALDDHPNVFRFDGRIWVSTAPREDAVAQLRAQRAWDAQNAKLQRWWVAIAIGAAGGVAATLMFGSAAELAPAVYLLLLPIGFGVGAVLGALLNKRFNAPDAQHSSLPPRPATVPLTQVPPRVARAAPADAGVTDLIEWSKRGFVS
ncbi:hypothetical protein QMG83_09195 [Salinibacterium sp. G-O1]|uniref:hypothetical protein n=1 Tax=Salinibacterium sp. G-O1 TaxID=3046208 RepID=UPI0024BA2852|nr:hypothetical protein [Salinibacterium sp. G-O1]MDJ0335396.1 hypothetical protein [Salinibacterium sp. G-O1]